MLSRRDLIHSRQFLRKRVLTALVTHQPDPLEWSGVRLGAATMVAVMVLVISVAAVGIYGFIRPSGNKQWRECDRVIIEQESGAAYVCGDGVLYPTLNYTSAALLRGLDNPPIKVARKSLTWPRGPLVGIPGAPTTLPRAADLLNTEWSFCVRPQPGPRTVMLIGVPVEATATGGPSVVSADEAVAVVDTATDSLWIVHGGRRHPVRDRAVVSQALRINQVDTMRVSPAWLATLPIGGDIGKLEVPGRGGPVERLAQVTVGQLVRLANNDRTPSTSQHFVARPTGLQPISELQEALLRATSNDTSSPIEVSSLQLAGVSLLEPMTEQTIGTGRLPVIVPASRSAGVVCAAVLDASDQRLVTVGGWVPLADPGLTASPDRSSPVGALLAEQVVVAPGAGVLVQAMTSPTSSVGAVFLVTETGWRYALGSPAALALLGYSDVGPIALPSTVVERLTQGPALTELALATPGP